MKEFERDDVRGFRLLAFDCFGANSPAWDTCIEIPAKFCTYLKLQDIEELVEIKDACVDCFDYLVNFNKSERIGDKNQRSLEVESNLDPFEDMPDSPRKPKTEQDGDTPEKGNSIAPYQEDDY